jgi:hypothetical protein
MNNIRKKNHLCFKETGVFNLFFIHDNLEPEADEKEQRKEHNAKNKQ